MATGDILAVRVASAARDNGWVAEIDINNLATGGAYALGLGTNNDPSAAKIKLTVTSPGYDATGTVTTITRTVYGTMWERQPEPNQALADEALVSTTLTVRVALSDFIYAGDTVTGVIGAGFYTKTAVPNNAFSGSVTNNSTLTHPPCIGRWAWPGWDVVQSDFLLEAVCLHRSAQGGKPVAAVVFTVTDGTHTVSQTVTSMTVSSRAGASGTGKVLVYAATIPITSFTQGAVLTCNFTAYPWVGSSGAVLTSASGITPPDERLCPLLLVCDKTGAYAGATAVVDATNGHNSTAATWIAASQSAAESAYASSTANSYTTIGNAVQALAAYNNTNKSRNEPGGGIVLLTGNHAWPGTSPGADLGTMRAWVTITRLSTKTRAACVINTGANTTLNTQLVKVLDVTMAGSSTGQITGTGTTNVFWWDQCTVNMTGFAPVYQWRLCHATRCDVTALAGGFQAFGANQWPWALVRGCSYTQVAAGAGLTAEMYCAIGNRNLIPYAVVPGSAQASDNGIYAFNQVYFLNNVALITDPTWTITSGIAFVQNVIERMSTTGASVLEVHGGNCAAPTNNVLMWHNTFTGERFNNGYNDAGTTAFLHKNWSEIANIFAEWNNKDDTFTGTPNANRVGSWPVGYAVGHRGDHRRAAADPEWLGEFLGIDSVTGGSLGFVLNKGNNYNGSGGDGLGGGDYHLDPAGGGGALALLGAAVLPFDLDGTARALTNGDAGAFESQAASSSSDLYVGAGSVSAVYIGTDEASAVYLGADLVLGG